MKLKVVMGFLLAPHVFAASGTIKLTPVHTSGLPKEMSDSHWSYISSKKFAKYFPKKQEGYLRIDSEIIGVKPLADLAKNQITFTSSKYPFGKSVSFTRVNKISAAKEFSFHISIEPISRRAITLSCIILEDLIRNTFLRIPISEGTTDLNFRLTVPDEIQQIREIVAHLDFLPREPRYIGPLTKITFYPAVTQLALELSNNQPKSLTWKHLIVPQAPERKHPSDYLESLMRPSPLPLSSSSSSYPVMPSRSRTSFITEETPPIPLPRLNVDFKSLGIGGMDAPLNDILRALLSRCATKETLEKIGINDDHTKGIILYGPPGTGKTLIASRIAKILGVSDKNYSIVNGPEVMNSYLGQSEENIRTLFEGAENNPSELFVLFFDEFDAIAQKRSGSSSSGSQAPDRVVNQLLSKMDGAKKINNILIIAATNRLDVIDEAFLRPGRFSVQLRIGLPDAKGRGDIFNIHLKSTDQSVLEDIDISALIELTKNYTGAEIKGVCHEARLFALQSAATDPSDIASVDPTHLKITMAHFIAALQKVRPAFGQQADFDKQLPIRSIELASQNRLVETILHRLDCCRAGRVTSVLLTGEKGTGKSAIAGLVADQARRTFELIRVISAGVTQKPVMHQIIDAWSAAQAVSSTLIILKNINVLADMLSPKHFTKPIMKQLNALLNETTDRKIVLLATMTNQSSEIFSHINPTAAWTTTYSTTPLEPTDITEILRENNIHTPGLEEKLAGLTISQVLDILSASHVTDWDRHISLFGR